MENDLMDSFNAEEKIWGEACLPEPGLSTQGTADDLEAALEEFSSISQELAE